MGKLLASCDIQLDGSRPFDLQIRDVEAIHRMLRFGSLGMGESYMDGQWDCDRIDLMVERLHRAGAGRRAAGRLPYRWLAILSWLINLQSRSRAKIVGERHYDAGNSLYETMLDSYMNYSCAFWQRAASLEQAQQDKMELICRKLKLEPGMRVLDLGCGWGGMARYAAENFGVEVLGITISRAQYEWAQSRLKDLPIEIRLQDYRDVTGTFDRVWSIGMFEHVGVRNYQQFFRKCRQALRAGGLMLLQTIGANDPSGANDPWLHKYIFPNGSLPTLVQIAKATGSLFVLEDWHSFGAYYDQTLRAWHQRVNRAWDQLPRRYDERFRRMWNFYLLACAGAFRARRVQLWQIVLSNGSDTCYQRPTLDGMAKARA